MRYLTKSRFKLALECVTKLYYTGKPREYEDTLLDDPFLRELARGGFQVGELAKFLFCEDPVSDRITIETLDYEEALSETKKRLANKGNVVVAEAAFAYKSLFVRTDIIRKIEKGLDLFEVKAKSVDPGESFLLKNGNGVQSEWEKYLYDVAFQKYVVAKCLDLDPSNIHAHLVLVDKGTRSSVEGLNQKFKIYQSENGRLRVQTEPGLKREHLGATILRIENVDGIIEMMWKEIKSRGGYPDLLTFEGFIDLCAETYYADRRVFTPVGSRCKECQFSVSEGNKKGLKDGRLECWKQASGYDDERLRKDWVIEIAALGAPGIADDLVMKRKFLVEEVDEGDLKAPKSRRNSPGLSWYDRRVEQVRRARARTLEPYVDRDGLKKEMSPWRYPLHMIDFETMRTALPFHRGKRPYEGIAFQFSHHVMEENGEIRHAGEFLSFVPGAFPNYDLVRELKRQLENDEGSIFRYHSHENTFLNEILQQLETDPQPPPDREELQQFIRSITKDGEREMVDLYALVVPNYYSPAAKGSTSLKYILPAIIHDSAFLREKYSRPIYGRTCEIKSLNFEEHVWIQGERGNDPYKTLPPLFPEYDNEGLDRMAKDLVGIDEGGAAMTAYNILQFSELAIEERKALEAGLLRYCELDTMAMVMLVEGWKDLINVSVGP